MPLTAKKRRTNRRSTSAYSSNVRTLKSSNYRPPKHDVREFTALIHQIHSEKTVWTKRNRVWTARSACNAAKDFFAYSNIFLAGTPLWQDPAFKADFDAKIRPAARCKPWWREEYFNNLIAFVDRWRLPMYKELAAYAPTPIIGPSINWQKVDG